MKLDLQSLVIFCIFFIPGIIWNLIAIKYKHGRNRSPSDTMFIIQSIVLSGVTYSFEFPIIYLLHLNFNLLHLNFINILIVILSIPVAFLLSMVDLALGKYRFFQRLLQQLPLTDRYGHEDVWEYLIRSKKHDNDWVDIRDFENKIIYSGRVELFSDTDKVRELFLKEVMVYDFKYNELYEVPEMYISRPSESVIIEFRSNEAQDIEKIPE